MHDRLRTPTKAGGLHCIAKPEAGSKPWVSAGRRAWACLALVGLLGGVPVALAAKAGPKGGTEQALTLMVVGDSLSAEYGLPRGSGWVALLERRLQQEARRVRVVNASISGDTSSGGLARLPALLQTHKPGVVVIELGGNDALRGLVLDNTRDNLRRMIRLSQAQGARVLLVGMQVPPNYGRKYTEAFAQLFPELARSEKTALVPFMLAGVADTGDDAKWFQPDRIHPLAQAHPRILQTIWPALSPLLP
jgi:acyl-CoA thioesterase-1